MSDPDSQPGLRIPRGGEVTDEQRALSSTVFEAAYVGERFAALSRKLDAATIDRNFAGAYLDIADECHDLIGTLRGVEKKLRERAHAEMKRNADGTGDPGQARR